MGSGLPNESLSERKARAIISLQIAIESARAAGLEVASPFHAGEDPVLLVYGGEPTAESPLRARRVRVLAFYSGIETTALGRPVAPGELLALVEWGGLGEGDAVFVLAAKDVDGMRSGEVELGDCIATTGRWRTLVLK